MFLFLLDLAFCSVNMRHHESKGCGPKREAGGSCVSDAWTSALQHLVSESTLQDSVDGRAITYFELDGWWPQSLWPGGALSILNFSWSPCTAAWSYS